MTNYPGYSRPSEFIDIPANPGFRVRKKSRWGSSSDIFEHIIAWRIHNQQNPLAIPFVCGPQGVSLLRLEPQQGDTYEFLLPGQEEKE